MDILRLVRPWQWVKNLFVFLPMFFGRRMTDIACIEQATVAFFAISFIAGAVYCLNDVVDAEENRLHPRKCRRPVASGAVGKPMALAVMSMMLLAGFAVLIIGISPECRVDALIVTGVYLLINVAYCLGIKKIAIIDVFCIASGFVLRVVLGGVVCGIWLSPWILCLTFLLTLMMAFAKRRDDVRLRETSGTVARQSTLQYNVEYLNQILGLLGAITMVCYVIYTVQPEVEARFGSQYVYVTAIFVLAGILRYLQLSMVHDRAGDPTMIILRDRFIQLCVIGWVISFALIIYM